MIRVPGLLTLPLVILLAAIANLSLRSRGGDDCLGYTAIAVRPEGIDKNALSRRSVYRTRRAASICTSDM
jgi:hypothetical protein